MTALPDWMVPPRPEGWFAEDLDALPDAPRHTELWDGALVFMRSPQRAGHVRVVNALEAALISQAPDSFDAIREMSVRLDPRTRPEPDLIVTTEPIAMDRTFFEAREVALVVEVVSPESAHRDRSLKPARYALAGIPSFWRVEEDAHGGVHVHVHELDPAGASYVAVDTFRGQLTVEVPFAIDIDLDDLTWAGNRPSRWMELTDLDRSS